MRNLPNFNFPAFADASAKLRALGYEVFSPAERDENKHNPRMFKGSGDINAIEGKGGFSLREVLGADLDWIARNADAVVLLPGWDKSMGAKAERALCEALGPAAVPPCRAFTLEEALALGPAQTN
jgi:Domain of unknown function (DUF4406)